MTGRSLNFVIAVSAMLVALTLGTGCEPIPRSGVPTMAEPAESPRDPTVDDSGGEATRRTDDSAPNQTPIAPAAIGPAATAATGTQDGESAARADSAADQPGPATPPARTLFTDWPTPRLVLLVTGQQHGYIEPCGCTQLANQKGGLARRHTLVKQLAARGWPVVGLDAGNQVRRFGRQAEIKFHMALDGLKTIGYQAIVLGTDDLRLSVDELVAATVPLEGQSTPFLCANAAVLDWSLMPDHKIIERGGKKIGVTAIVGEQWKEDVSRDDIVFKNPVEGLRTVVPKLQAAKCDVLVLLAHASVAEAKKLASEFPEFNLVVAAGAAGDGTDPLYQPEKVEGSKAMFVQSGVKGMFAGVIGVFDDAETPLRYQRVPLDLTFQDSPEMLQLLKSYQDQLETLGLAGLGLRPVAHPSGNNFVGSEKCGECHTKAYAVWEKTPHASATNSLVNPVERAEIQRHFDPECLSCHVTGWHPQRFFPYNTGYLDLAQSKHLHGNGCENCHGPGSAHVDAEEGTTAADDAMLKMLRTSMRQAKATAEKKCVECHDIDNSPGFYAAGAFERYWHDVEHKGLD